MTLVTKIAHTIQAIRACRKNDNSKAFWLEKHGETLRQLEGLLPSGAGFDTGTKIVLDECILEPVSKQKLVFYTQFHHMNDNGFYTHWTDHRVTVRPDLLFDLDIKISGQNSNNIKDYMYDVFFQCLLSKVEINEVNEKQVMQLK